MKVVLSYRLFVGESEAIVPVLDPAAPGRPTAPRSAPSSSFAPEAIGAAAGEAAGLVRSIDGELIAIDRFGEPVVLADGDPVAAGEVLISRGGGHAVIDLASGGSLAMSGTARAEIGAGDAGGRAHIVAHAGAFVVAAGAPGGDSGGIVIESGAAVVVLDAGVLALRYDLDDGLRAAAVPGEAAVAARIVNDSGVQALDPTAPAFAVAHWAAPPELLSAGARDPEWLASEVPVELPAQSGAEADPQAAAGDLAQAEAAAEEAAAGETVDADLGPAFATGAGAAEDGDPTVSFPARASAPYGFADAAAALPPLPAPSAEPMIFTPAPRPEPFGVGGHSIDPLVLWQVPAEPRLPPAEPGPVAPPPVPPTLRGWDGKGLAWDIAGTASVCGTQREWPAWPDRPLLEIEPREGQTMAGLSADGVLRNDLERFLGLGFDQLNTLIDGAAPFNGSAIRTSVALKAGQTLVFDVLFDADEPTNSNDFAAFTVSRGGGEDSGGEGFVLSSIAATGDFGASPWQSLRYTAGATGTYAIGFLVVNDKSAHGPALLYVDAMRAALQASDLHLITEQSDGFGGRFELFSPEPEDRGSEPRLLCGFETDLDADALCGEAAVAGGMVEPDGSRSVYTPTEGESMAVLHARGEMRPKLEAFLGLEKAPGAVTALPVDADGSIPGFGAATRLTVAVAEGDRISFDWMFDAGDFLPDNDFAVFTVAGASGGSQVFKLADVRATGDAGATGWRTSLYTAAEAGELTVGFAVVNDWRTGYAGDPENSRLLVDNVWLNRETAGGYQLADLADPGALATLPAA